MSKQFNAITEFKSINSQEIKIWIYTIPIRDTNTQHKENYQIIKELKKLNQNNKTVVFNEFLIGSFEQINNWGEYSFANEEYRNINTTILTEKRLLERLLMEDIKTNIDTNKYGTKINSIYIKQPILYKNNLIIRRKINFDINIEKNKQIIIGFSLSHEYEYINTLEKEIQIKNISKGELVKDFYNNTSSYKFIGLAPYTISEYNDELKGSIIDYYNAKGMSYVVSKLDSNTRAVLVETEQGKILPYIPNRLKKVCTCGNIPSNMRKECDKHTKLKANEKMQLSIDLTQDMLKNTKYIKFDKHNILIEKLGYKKVALNKPTFLFGNNNKNSSIFYGLQQNGTYEQKEIEVSYFIDPTIVTDKNKFEKIIKFTKELETYSKEIGVPIKRMPTYISFGTINTDNKDIFEAELREKVEKYHNSTVMIMEDSNCEKYYSVIKKIFGNKNNIATQFIELSTLNYNEQSKVAILLNILLGIYAKSGIQPWILQKPLNADCYIGIDVSRENKLNTAGVIQVIGKDGRILRTKSITSAQSGEKINIETIKDIFHETNSSYKKVYGKSPEHIIFHRDGISREELDLLKETADNLDIKFDYIEITKKVNRRMACFNDNEKQWETQMGVYYKKENTAYMITTNPTPRIGMAIPLRIKKVYGELSIESIVEDAYKLSFMHIGSILKSRLPVTTHYADLSSTFGNRELMPSNIDGNVLHFI